MQRFLISLLLTGWSFLFYGQTVLDDPHWDLEWEDQFNDGIIDENKWMRVHYVQHGDKQLQIYLKDHVKEEYGNLVITVDDESTYCHPDSNNIWGACWPCDDYKTYNYTSGWIESQAAFNFEYGLIEARIKLPYGNGFHSSFWTFKGFGVSGDNGNEIDIFENLGKLPSSIITTNLHTCYGSACEPDYYQENNIGNYAYTWHNYAVVWSPQRIIWYIDGKPYRVANNIGIDDPARIIFSLAIEKDYPPDNSTPFPSNYYVDYVKVYQLKNDCSTNLNIDSSNDFSTFDHKVKNKITIQGPYVTIKVPANSSVYLRADYKFEIKSSFEIPLGSTFFVDVNTCH